MRVVIAQGDAAARGALAALLGSLGYETTQVSTTAAALAVLRQASGPMMGLLGWDLVFEPGVARGVRRSDAGLYVGVLTDRPHNPFVVETGSGDRASPGPARELRIRVRSAGLEAPDRRSAQHVWDALWGHPRTCREPRAPTLVLASGDRPSPARTGSCRAVPSQDAPAGHAGTG